ncbi:hypothetical protein BGX24_012506 [Mortierella sp. AD032]|nr:hypothetical protein BGX24_012506 [Mortierella sp. AD032]
MLPHNTLPISRHIVKSITNELHTESITNELHTITETTRASSFLSLQFDPSQDVERAGRVAKLPSGGNRYSRSCLEQKHLNWIKKNRLFQEPGLPISDLHAELNKKFTLEPPDYNGDAGREHRKLWADKVWEKYGGMDGFVYLYETEFTLHIRQSSGRIASELKIRAYKGVHFVRYLKNKLFLNVPSLQPKAKGWFKEGDHDFQLSRANMPLGRFMNTKQALHLVERDSDPYPEVERDHMEDEDQEEDREE